jgi:hypothetical protein
MLVTLLPFPNLYLVVVILPEDNQWLGLHGTQIPLILSLEYENWPSFQYAVIRILNNSYSLKTQNHSESTTTHACWQIHNGIWTENLQTYPQHVPRSTQFNFLCIYTYLYLTVIKKLKEHINPQQHERSEPTEYFKLLSIDYYYWTVIIQSLALFKVNVVFWEVAEK